MSVSRIDYTGVSVHDLLPLIEPHLPELALRHDERLDPEHRGRGDKNGRTELADRAGVSPRYVRSLFAGEQWFITLAMADRLLLACGEQRIPDDVVIPNAGPKAPRLMAIDEFEVWDRPTAGPAFEGRVRELELRRTERMGAPPVRFAEHQAGERARKARTAARRRARAVVPAAALAEAA